MDPRADNPQVSDDTGQASTSKIRSSKRLSGATLRRTLAERTRRPELLTSKELEALEPKKGELRKPMGPPFDESEAYDRDAGGVLDDEGGVDGTETEPAALVDDDEN